MIAPIEDGWRRWHPTARLKFVYRAAISKNILQQEWQHEETGRTAWRDVPMEFDSLRGSADNAGHQKEIDDE